MNMIAAKRLLLDEAHLEEDFFAEDPSAAFDPVFVSGDTGGSRIVEITNGLTNGELPGVHDFASALFTNVAGSVVFHNSSVFASTAYAVQLFNEFRNAALSCAKYSMRLNDGVEVDIERQMIRDRYMGPGSTAFEVKWLSKVDHYEIATSWFVVTVRDAVSFLNTRLPETSEHERLARLVLDLAVAATSQKSSAPQERA